MRTLLKPMILLWSGLLPLAATEVNIYLHDGRVIHAVDFEEVADRNLVYAVVESGMSNRQLRIRKRFHQSAIARIEPAQNQQIWDQWFAEAIAEDGIPGVAALADWAVINGHDAWWEQAALYVLTHSPHDVLMLRQALSKGVYYHEQKFVSRPAYLAAHGYAEYHGQLMFLAQAQAHMARQTQDRQLRERIRSAEAKRDREEKNIDQADNELTRLHTGLAQLQTNEALAVQRVHTLQTAHAEQMTRRTRYVTEHHPDDLQHPTDSDKNSRADILVGINAAVVTLEGELEDARSSLNTIQETIRQTVARIAHFDNQANSARDKLNDHQNTLYDLQDQLEIPDQLSPIPQTSADRNGALEAQPSAANFKTVRACIASAASQSNLNQLTIVAADGSKLGSLHLDNRDPQSIFYGFDQPGRPFIPQGLWQTLDMVGNSAFDPTATEPPMLFYRGKAVCYVSENTALSPRVSPFVLFAAVQSTGSGR